MILKYILQDIQIYRFNTELTLSVKPKICGIMDLKYIKFGKYSK